MQTPSSSFFLFPRRGAALAVTLACSVLVVGCSHTTQLAQQGRAVAVPAQWHASGAQPQPTPPDDLSQWWQRFGDAQLTGLIEQALAANPSVLSAQAAVRQARAQRDVQVAGTLPSVNLGGSAQRSRQGNNGANNRFGVNVDAGWEPDWWGTQANALQASEANVAAAQASLEGAYVSLAAEVALSYVELRNLQQRLVIAQRNLAIQRETQQITEWRVQAGLATSLDSEQARQSTAQTAAQVPALQSSLAQSRHALAVLTGQTPETLEAVLASVAAVPQAPAALAMALPADTLRQRPDVRVQERKVDAALANLSAQERANYPSLRLNGSLGLSALTLGALTNGASVAASLAASLSAPLFDGGANRAQIRSQEEAVAQARLGLQSTVLAALQEVEDALVQLQGDRDRLVQLQVAQEAAANAALLARQRYSSGLIDFQTVLDTQRTELSTQDSVAQAQAAISADHIRLYKALGGGWQPQAAAEAHVSAPSAQP